MIFWVDAQLSPALAPWITENFSIEAYSVKWLGFRDAEDGVIFQAAREAGAVVITKDRDFLNLLEENGPPPQVLWITLGNTTNARIRDILVRHLPEAVELFRRGEALIEIGEP